MPGYIYDSTTDMFTSQSAEMKPIRRESAIRHKIDRLNYEKNEFYAMSSIADNYLGVTDS